MAYSPLHERLRGPIADALKKQLKQENTLALPRLEKVTINVGLNKAKMDSKETRAYVEECLMKITGQKPVFTKARQAISNFKTRQGMIVGSRVTLRGKQMEEFLDRLLSYSLPRIRDFRGLPTKLDGRGNYSIGLKDHSIFPEVPPPDAKQIFSLQIVVTTTADNDEAGMALLKEMGFPFKRSSKDKPEEKKDAGEVAKPAETNDTTASEKAEETSDESSPSDA